MGGGEAFAKLSTLSTLSTDFFQCSEWDDIGYWGLLVVLRCAVLILRWMVVEQVLFTDQHGHHVEHNPEALEHGEYTSRK